MIESTLVVHLPEPASVAADYSIWVGGGRSIGPVDALKLAQDGALEPGHGLVLAREVAGVPIVSLAGDRRSPEWAEQQAAVLLAAAVDARRRAGRVEHALGVGVRRRAYCDGCGQPVCAVGAEDPCSGCCACRDRCLEATEQPDGIDSDSYDLPDPARAAKRIDAYLSSCGDGLYDEADGNPLYARDLQALTRGVDRWQQIAIRLTLAAGSFRLLSTRDRDELEEAIAEYRQVAQDGADRVAELGRDAAGGEPVRGDPP